MAKSTSSLASSTSTSSSASNSTSSSTSSAASSASTSSTRCSASDKALGLRPSSSIDRRKRLAANARERKRMHLLNRAYDELRQRLVDAENKSKYDVLVQAKEYIQALAALCENFDREHPEQASQLERHYILDQKIQSSPVDMTYNPTSCLEPTGQQQLQSHTNYLSCHNHHLQNQKSHTGFT